MYGEDRQYTFRPRIKEAMDRYGKEGVPTGDFLRAVLANDLMEAVGRADDFNQTALPAICMYVYNELPSICHGSYDMVDTWITRHKDKKGLDKKMEEDRGEA